MNFTYIRLFLKVIPKLNSKSYYIDTNYSHLIVN